MKARPKSQGGAAGFTLLEVVVSLAIAALVVGAALATTSRALDGAGRAAAAVRAVLAAESKLVEVAAFARAPGDFQGKLLSGEDWSATIRPHMGAPAADAPGISGSVPLEVTVSVRWGARPGEEVTLSTLALAPRPPGIAP